LCKRLEHTSLVPGEALHCIFKYLSFSDLLRCTCVCKTWKDVAQIQSLWHKIFRRLPKACQNLSDASKTTGLVDWKRECLNSAKERRKTRYQSFTKTNNLHSGKKKKAEATKLLGVRWMLSIEEKSMGRVHQFIAEEDFIFTHHNLTARWNDLYGAPSLPKCKNISLTALTPLLYDSYWKPLENSVCTRSLMTSHDFKGATSPIKTMRLVHQDKELTLYSLGQLYFGIWTSSLPKDGEIAFIGFTTPVHGLLSRTQEGKSNRAWSPVPHQPIPDDVNRFYGLHGYTVRMCLRNSRKGFYEGAFEFPRNGEWDSDWLCFEHKTVENPLYDEFFFDIKHQVNFSWKSTALNGRIENVAIMDIEVKDFNNEIFWNVSTLASMKTIEDDLDFANYNLREINYAEDDAKISIRILQDKETKSSLVLSIKLSINKLRVNRWFGMKH